MAEVNPFMVVLVFELFIAVPVVVGLLFGIAKNVYLIKKKICGDDNE